MTTSMDFKPLVFISIEGGPDETSKNWQALAVSASKFKTKSLDGLFMFTYAPDSSAYNFVERRIALFSKNTAGIIFSFAIFGNQ